MSNQEAIWLLDDSETAEELKKSDFYMIAQRAEAKFENWVLDADDEGDPRIRATVSTSDLSDSFELNIAQLLADGPFEETPVESIVVEFGDKVINILSAELSGEVLLDFFTTEKLIWQRSLRRPGISGLNLVRQFATYNLLYVGMAKESNTFSRLIAGSHEARQRILGEQFAVRAGSRVSDEVILFAFNIDHFGFRTLSNKDVFSVRTPGQIIAHDRAVTADAEKAFIALLDPRYNRQKYANYPRGEDGLYSAGLTSYGYFLCENVTFTTSSLSLVGATKPVWSGGQCERLPTDGADVILITGDDVVVKQGDSASGAAHENT